jgi:hypothetical protein
VLGCDKDSFFIYDDDNDKTDLLRVVKGSSKTEIAIVQFNLELSFIVTGSVSGDIALHDYESSSLLGYGLCHKAEVTTMNFMWPYPILISTSMCNRLCIW